MKFKKGHIPYFKGKKLLEEQIRKRTETRRKNGWFKNPEKTSKKMSENMKGKKKPLRTEEHKRNLTKAAKGRYHLEETKRKIRETMKTKKKSKEQIEDLLKAGMKNRFQKGQFSGEKHFNWQGGISFEPYTTDWTETLRRAIRERDNYICQLCSQYGNTVHHKNYIKEDCNLNNLITLCRKCNTKVNFNRDYWKQYFSKHYGNL